MGGGETEGLMLLFWSALLVGGRVVRWEGVKCGRVMKWQCGKSWRVMRWQGGKGGMVMR